MNQRDPQKASQQSNDVPLEELQERSSDLAAPPPLSGEEVPFDRYLDWLVQNT